MLKILIAAGGTGGHLFPALAVIEKLTELANEDIEYQFFGRKDKIEGRIVPALGYKLHSTTLFGLVRPISIKTLKLPFQILLEINKLKRIIKKDDIDAVLCTGAYLSYPAGIAAFKCNKKLFLMESNINPGKAISMLASRADTIFTTFDETKDYFKPLVKSKLINYGNPVRKQILEEIDKNVAIKKFNLDATKPVILVFGGSLGATTINNAVLQSLELIANSNYQLLWQIGNSNTIDIELPRNVRLVKFIDDMASAYSAADLVVARSGATTIAELSICGKPSILVPLPSASNNEQYFNAKYLEKQGASIAINNADISVQLYENINKLMNNPAALTKMGNVAKALGRPKANELIAKEILRVLGRSVI